MLGRVYYDLTGIRIHQNLMKKNECVYSTVCVRRLCVLAKLIFAFKSK